MRVKRESKIFEPDMNETRAQEGGVRNTIHSVIKNVKISFWEDIFSGRVECSQKP